MKLLILSVLVASSLCLTLQPNQARFEPSKLYVYDYESQVLTGLPTFSKQYAGIKVVCQVRLTFGSPATLQLANIQLYQLNKEIEGQENLPPMAQLPNSQFTELPTEDQILIRQKLIQPIRFMYVESKVTSIQVCEKEETNWSIDIKRSILSLLQVKLQPDESDYKVTEKLEYNKLTDQQITTFDILEPAMDGTCYSSLHVYRDQTNTNNKNKTYNVIKVRDRSRCLTQHLKVKNTYPQRQSNCDCRKNLNRRHELCQCMPVSTFRNSTDRTLNSLRAEYELTSEDEKKFVIQRVAQSVELKLEFPQAVHQFALTTSNQTLWLKEVKNLPSPLPTCSFKQVSEPWRFRVLRQGEGKPMMTSTQLQVQVDKVLDELVTISQQPQRTEDHLVVFFQLVEMLRQCTLAQLERLFTLTKHAESQPQHNKRWQVYVDALSQVNTTDADLLILRKMNSGELTSLDAVNVMMTWTASKVPTRTILDYMHDYLLTTLARDTARKNVYYHSMLCFGSMVRRYIHSEEIMIDQCILPADKATHQDNIDYCRKFEKMVEGRLSVAKSVEDKIMQLKTIANMGSVASIPLLQDELGEEQPLVVRVHAIWAFKNMGFQNKLKTVQSLSPIMLNHHADIELRIAAFIMVMRCNPTSTFLELQRHLNNERNQEFKTYVVRYMRNMLQEQQPECPTCQTGVRQVLKSIRAFKLSQRTNDFQMKYGLKSNDGQGDMIRIRNIGTRGSNVPQSASIQHFTGWNGQWNHLWEIGYRTQGLKSLVEKLSQKVPVSSIFRKTLRQMITPGSDSGSDEKPSITFYARVLGQQISFYHLDENKMASMLLAGSSVGSIVIPLKFFKTAILTPKNNRMLQPSGFMQTTCLSHAAILDIDGQLRVELNEGRMPVFSFESNKPIRAEVRTMWTNEIDSGFAMTGMTSMVANRAQVKTNQLSIKYDMGRNFLAINFTDNSPSTNTFVHWNTSAVTNTEYVPLRLPHFESSVQQVAKELAVDESEKEDFETEITAFKSVELEAKIKASVNMPELYSFVRDRIMFLPTCLSIFRQTLSLRVQPTASSTRTFAITSLFQYPTSAISQMPAESVEDEPQSVKIQGSGFINYFFGGSQQVTNKPTISSENSQESVVYQQASLGSLCQLYSVSLASISGSRVLNMTSEIENFYEHDYPTSRFVWKAQRPAIRSEQESEPQVWINNMTSVVNPSSNKVVKLFKIRWGPKSNSNKHRITLTATYKPSYKDNVCEEQNAYGCKDKYGVTYPIWYSNHFHVEEVNTEIVQTIRDWVEPYLINTAESVYMYPNKQQQPRSSKTFNINFVVQPTDNMISYVCYDKDFVTNVSRVWAPVETKLHNYNAEVEYPISKAVGFSGNGVLPIHHMSGPLAEKRITCHYGYGEIMTFENKILLMPKTNCEITFAGDYCANPSNNFELSITPNINFNTPKIVKLVVKGEHIQFERKLVHAVAATYKIDVTVNGENKPSERPLNVDVKTKTGEIVAKIECRTQDRCVLLALLDSPQHNYVNFQGGLVTVAIEDSRINSYCGICARNASLPERSNKEESKAIIERHIVKDQQCEVRQPVSYSGGQHSQQNYCQMSKKHKVIVKTENGELQSCVTVEQFNSCNRGCRQIRQRHVENVRAYCVSQSKAQELKVQPTLHGSELVADISQQVLESLQSHGQQRNINVDVYDQCQ